jgi:hypothetical protein
METVSIILAVIAGTAVLVLLFRPFFGDKDGFFECIKFWFTPDIFSLFFGKYFHDIFSEMKLGLWIFCGVITGIGVHIGLMKLFG